MVKTMSPEVGLEAFPGHRLRQLLGRGGLGEVWETDVADGSRVALKFIATEENLLGVKELRAIQAIRDLCHPNLVRIGRVWSQSGYFVFSMELAEGSLLDLLDAHLEELGRAMEPAQVCLYLSQVADALDFLNSRTHLIDGQRVGIQHCDVKPSNMLLFGDTVKLSDFGLARLTFARAQVHQREGTPDYASPEVFFGQLSDQSDQYALAVSYCVLRCGRLPFPEAETFDPAGLRRRPKPDLSLLLPAEQPIIARALEMTPQDRWPNCRELMGRLTAAARVVSAGPG
jgi:serine/threonine-protein kinase